jgi:hypothetical protein
MYGRVIQLETGLNPLGLMESCSRPPKCSPQVPVVHQGRVSDDQGSPSPVPGLTPPPELEPTPCDFSNAADGGNASNLPLESKKCSH